MKIGVLGGTFDPPHFGHLAIAKAALASLELDEVLFMPVSRNPVKKNHKGTSPKHRLEMVKLLVADEEKMAVSDLEVTRGGVSYTVDTITELQMAQPADYWFLLGADALQSIATWKQPERLVKLCRLGFVARGTRVVEDVLIRIPADIRSQVDHIEMPLIDISSSDLRNKLARGQSVNPWIPEKVRDYIESNKLYKNL